MKRLQPTLGFAVAALAALPWLAAAQGTPVGGASAGLHGGVTSGNVTTGVAGNADFDAGERGPRGVLRMPTDPNMIRNERSPMDGHMSDRVNATTHISSTGTVRGMGPSRHGTMRTHSTTHGTIRH